MFTSLHHLIDLEWMFEAFRLTRKDGAPGVDGVTADEYEANLEANLTDLLARLKSGRYVAPPVRRHYIPKADGTKRPLGIPTLEDKVAQRAIVLLLEPIYETAFLPCSFGFRPGRSAHDALRALRTGFMERGLRWVVDVDISKYLYVASYCPQVHEVRSKSSGCRAIALIRSPFCFPRMTWTASSSPRLTRCNTVWRETPSAFIASRMGMKLSPASLLKRAMTSSSNRMRHGAPGSAARPG